MRLTRHQMNVIHDAAREVFGPEARVKLFGSRLNDEAKGGDIDLLVECPQPVKNAGLLAARLEARIQKKIGDRKLDVLYVWPGMRTLPVHEAAMEQGVEL